MTAGYENLFSYWFAKINVMKISAISVLHWPLSQSTWESYLPTSEQNPYISRILQFG
jgi:hypothetical protein